MSSIFLTSSFGSGRQVLLKLMVFFCHWLAAAVMDMILRWEIVDKLGQGFNRPAVQLDLVAPYRPLEKLV